MTRSSFSFDDRLQQLQQFEAEHGHMFVPRDFSGSGNLGRWVDNTRCSRRKGKVKPEAVATLDEIGFAWTVPKGPKKDQLIEWGKQFKWLVRFQKTKGHCDVPSKIAGKAVPAAAWCDEQRALYMNNKLEQGKIDKLSNIGFDFYGSSIEEPALKRQRTETDNEVAAMKEEIETLKDENETLKDENETLKDENETLKDENQTLHDEIQALKDETQALKDEI